jgi:hypothetical protein
MEGTFINVISRACATVAYVKGFALVSFEEVFFAFCAKGIIYAFLAILLTWLATLSAPFVEITAKASITSIIVSTFFAVRDAVQTNIFY